MGMFSTAGAVYLGCGLTRKVLERYPPQKKRNASGTAEYHPYENAGAAFGWKWLKGRGLLALSGGALASIVWMGGRSRRIGRFGAGLALGGGISNLWERLNRGSVLDYLRFPKAPWPVRRYTYNAADLSIFAGLTLLFLGGRKNP